MGVTVTCRLGVDDFDSPECSAHFVRTVSEGGARHFIIHARKAYLEGLSSKDNREIPPLMYDRVMWLCEEFPDLHFTLNGGITKLDHLKMILEAAPKNLIGVMVGRLARDNPCELWDVDRYIFNEPLNPGGDTVSRHSILEAYCRYLHTQYPFGEMVGGFKNGIGVSKVLKPV